MELKDDINMEYTNDFEINNNENNNNNNNDNNNELNDTRESLERLKRLHSTNKDKKNNLLNPKMLSKSLSSTEQQNLQNNIDKQNTKDGLMKLINL